MADSEWFEVSPSTNPGAYPNFEAADAAALKEMADGVADCVHVVKVTTVRVRRYTRQVTVTTEDVQAP